jgi:hypothetical protein
MVLDINCPEIIRLNINISGTEVLMHFSFEKQRILGSVFG